MGSAQNSDVLSTQGFVPALRGLFCIQRVCPAFQFSSPADNPWFKASPDQAHEAVPVGCEQLKSLSVLDWGRILAVLGFDLLFYFSPQ